MDQSAPVPVVVFVDPSCPYAWITERWLTEVEQDGAITLTVKLLSLAVVNDGRELDDWYRSFNDKAWIPARVMAAVQQAYGDDSARQFYEAYGQRFHIDYDTGDNADRAQLAADALAAVDLPTELIGAADNAALDDHLRAITKAALDPVGLDIGVPVTLIDGVASSGPVLNRIPRGAEAVEAFHAARTLANLNGYVRFERKQIGDLYKS